MFCNSDKQLNFLNSFDYIDDLASFKPLRFIKLLNDNFSIESFIPDSFYSSYYSSLGRDRSYELPSVLSALLIKQLFNIHETKFLVFCLAISKELRDFCRFDSSLPNESFFSTFKSAFESNIYDLFYCLVEHIIELFSDYSSSLDDNHPDKELANYLIFDTSGFKPKVKENNPKFVATEIRKQKNYASTLSNDSNFNPYASAYHNLPKVSSANSSIRLDYVNGHFGYFYKFGILTNGFGVPVGINFFDEDFYSSFKDVSFNSPEDQKFIYDNASLKPVLSKFPFVNKFSDFIGDSEFDSYENFGFLHSLGFSRAIIPINPRNSSFASNCMFKLNNDGVPLCPKTGEPFIYQGVCKGTKRSLRFKYICPKSFRPDKSSSRLSTSCTDLCKPTNSTVTTYIYPDGDFRLFPGIRRDSPEFDKAYSIRTSIERTISSFKANPSIAFPNTYKLSTMRADLLLTASAKVITAIMALSLNKISCVRSVNKLIKEIA